MSHCTCNLLKIVNNKALYCLILCHIISQEIRKKCHQKCHQLKWNHGKAHRYPNARKQKPTTRMCSFLIVRDCIFVFVPAVLRPKVWLWRFKSPVTNLTRWLDMGTYPVISLAEAREKVVFLAAKRRLGIDPIEEKSKLMRKPRPRLTGCAWKLPP